MRLIQQALVGFMVLCFASPLLAITPTTTTLVVSPSGSVTAGTVVTLTATVDVVGEASNVRTGTVNFCDASKPVCLPGDGLYATTQLKPFGMLATRAIAQVLFGVGTHNIKAVFVATASDATSSSSTQAIEVTASQIYASTTSLTASGSAGNYTLSGTVSGFGNQALSGSLEFLDTTNGNEGIGSATLGAPTFVMAPQVTYPTGSFPFGISVGDFNGDGIPDLAVVNNGGTVSVLLGNGNGTFQTQVTYAPGASPDAISVGDFNGDGIPDLAVANEEGATVSVLLGEQVANFSASDISPSDSAGTHNVLASYSGDSSRIASTSSTVALTVIPLASQTITFVAPASPVIFGASAVGLSATATSGLVVSFSVISGPCSVSDTTLTYTAVGTCVVAANQAGNADFAAAPQVTQSVVITEDFPTFSQVFTSSSSLNFGSPDTLTSLVNTGGHVPTGTVTFTSNGNSIGSGTVSAVSTTNLVLDSNFENGSTFWTLTGALPIVNGAAGMLGGNAFVYTGTGAASGFQFNSSAAITVTPGETYTLSGYIDATNVTSGTPSWDVFSTNIQTSFGDVSATPGTKGRVSLTFVVPAGVTQVVVLCDTSNATVTNGGQLIFSNPQLELASQVGPYVQTGTSATTGSGGSASFTTTALSVGTDSIVATFSGDASDQISTSAADSVAVTQAAQTITFGALANQTFGVAPFALSASASSGLPVSVSSLTTSICTVSGATVSVIGVGTCTIQATQAGNVDFTAAPAVSQSFSVGKGTATVAVTTTLNPSIFGDAVTFTATVTSGATGTVTFADGSTTLATVSLSGSVASFTTPTLSAGAHTITATYNGNANFD